MDKLSQQQALSNTKIFLVELEAGVLASIQEEWVKPFKPEYRFIKANGTLSGAYNSFKRAVSAMRFDYRMSAN